MPRQEENTQPEEVAAGSPRLESADEPETGQDQLEVRSKGSSSKIWLQKERFQAVEELGDQPQVLGSVPITPHGHRDGKPHSMANANFRSWSVGVPRGPF